MSRKYLTCEVHLCENGDNGNDLQEIIFQVSDCVHDVVNFFSGLCLSEFHHNSG